MFAGSKQFNFLHTVGISGSAKQLKGYVSEYHL